MKIGIITQPLLNNYGGLLQNYALQQVLRQLGHGSVTLNQIPVPWTPLRIKVLSNIKTLLLKILGNGNKRKFSWQQKKQANYRTKHTVFFTCKYINKTHVFSKTSEFRNYVVKNKIDALVVGSDQVWRPKYNHNIFWSFFNFAEKLRVKRISYAASFGVDFWEYSCEQTQECKRLVKLFDGVSVREKSAVNLCQKYLECKSEFVLDPTMLLEKEDYIHLVENEKEPMCNGELFTYILDASTQKLEYIERIAKRLSLKTFSCMPASAEDIYPPVTQWIRSFMDAKFVVCDSFHGAVFSIIFNKPFIVIGNKERGMSRFNSLLETFKLESRMLIAPDAIDSILMFDIDWNEVNRIRQEYKETSFRFLVNALM